MSSIMLSPGHGLSVGDKITLGVTMSWWQRLVWRLRHLTWKTPDRTQYEIIVVGDNYFDIREET